jgi:hypothetical protein
MANRTPKIFRITVRIPGFFAFSPALPALPYRAACILRPAPESIPMDFRVHALRAEDGSSPTPADGKGVSIP